MNERVAVVIPLYNHERFIQDALRSVINQTLPPSRVIVVDDGSSDNSVKVARSVDDPRIGIFTQANAGAHTALNRGVELASDCELVAILNSDDLYHPSRLAACVAALRAEPNCQLVCTRFGLIDDGGSTLPPDHPRTKWFAAAWSPQTSNISMAAWLGLANFAGTTSNFVARTQWLRNHPFRPYRYAHDYFMLVEAALEDALVVLRDELLSYRVHAANTITTDPVNLVREMLQVNTDLARLVAPRLLAEPNVRSRYVDYLRASWSNVSAFRQDLFAIAGAIALAGKADTEDLLVLLGETQEAREFPNRALVNQLSRGETLGSGIGIGEKYAELKRENARLKDEARTFKRDLAAASLAGRQKRGGLLRLLRFRK